MPVDNQAIQDKIDELQVKSNANHKERKELYRVISELQSIVEEEDSLSETEPKTMKPIIDRGTGVVINVARRQAIYDAQLIKADALLS